ncbi:hypothetical protein [Tessaracoccus sp. Y1736]
MPNDNTNTAGFQAVAEESFNDNSTNTNLDADLEVEIEDSLNDNSDNSTNTEIDTEVEVEDSFNETETDTEIDDSYNVDNSLEHEDSYNDNSENLDVEVEIDDSFNRDESVKTQDSFNITSSFNEQTLNDNSTTVGVRQYQTNVGDLNLGGMGGMLGGKAAYGHGGGADLELDNRSMNVDQSVNQIINAGDDVDQDFSQTANVAFGDHSMAAGDDIDIDNSSMSVELGDISIGNTWIDTRINDSFQDNSVDNDYDWEMEIDDSFNDQSTDLDVEVDIEDSFTNEVTELNSFEWENEGNVFSPGAATTGGEVIDVEL